MMNILKEYLIYRKLKQNNTRFSGDYSFGMSSISYGYVIPWGDEYLISVKTLNNADTHKFSYQLHIKPQNATRDTPATYTNTGDFARRVFNLLNNKELGR